MSAAADRPPEQNCPGFCPCYEKFPYLRDWPAKFDFALIVDSDGAVDMSAMLSDDADLSKLLRVVVRTDFATLLRVCRPAPCS